MTNKTTEALKLAGKALGCSQQHLDLYHPEWVITRQQNDKALAAIREALAEPVTISCDCGDIYERNSFGGKFIQQYGCCPNCDAAKPVKQEPVSLDEVRRIAAEYAEPNSQVDSGNLYWALCEALKYAAPVSAKREFVELTDDELKAALEVHQVGLSVRIGRIAIAAFKEKNK